MPASLSETIQMDSSTTIPNGGSSSASLTYLNLVSLFLSGPGDSLRAVDVIVKQDYHDPR